MANTKLTEILSDLAEATRIASVDLSGWDPRTVTGMVSRKRQAEDDVASMTTAYHNLVGNHVLKVFVTGERAKEFAEFARESGVIVVDGSDLYRILAKGVDDTLDSKTRLFSAQQQLRLVEELGSYGSASELKSLPMPSFSAEDFNKPCATFEDTVAMVRKGVRAKSADELNKHHLERLITKACMKDQADANVIAVILTNVSKEEIESLSKILFNQPAALVLDAGPKSTNKKLVDEVNAKILALAPKQAK